MRCYGSDHSMPGFHSHSSYNHTRYNKKQPGQNQRLFVSISNANKVQRLPLMKRGKQRSKRLSHCHSERARQR